jgi:hypothetical protein
MSYRISSFMSSCMDSQLESTIAAHQAFTKQLYEPANQMHLDTLYMHMLSICSDDETEHAGRLLTSAALLNAHPTPTLLAALLLIPLPEVVMLVRTFLGARLLTTEIPLDTVAHTTSLRVCHDSLRGFLVDPLRCRLKQYLVSPQDGHEALLNRCLSLLNEHLRQDMCEIRNPGLANADVPDLRARIARYVPEPVRYACVAWPVHLVGIRSLSDTVSAALLHFCTEHLLHWLEVLSLLEELSSAGNHAPKVIAWCQVSLLYVTQCRLMRTNRINSSTCL